MSSRKDDHRRAVRQLGNLLSAGLVFPISIAIGYAVGHYLDRWFGTSYFVIIFLLFGIAAGFLSFYRAVLAAEQDDSSAGK